MTEQELSLEERKFTFEQEKWRSEKFRLDELHKKAIHQINLSPTVVTLIAAVIGLLGTLTGATLKGNADAQLENERLRSELILKAVDTKDPNEAAKFLKFLKDIGLVSGLRDIDQYIENPKSIPLRPKDVRSYLKFEVEKSAAVAQKISELLYRGEISKEEAERLLQLQKARMASVMQAVSNMSSTEIEQFIAHELEKIKKLNQSKSLTNN